VQFGGFAPAFTLSVRLRRELSRTLKDSERSRKTPNVKSIGRYGQQQETKELCLNLENSE